MKLFQKPMTKKEDTRKPVHEEGIGLNHAAISSLFICLLFFSTEISAQLNISGFGKAKVLQTIPGYSSIYLTDYNLDDRNDLILFSNSTNNLLLIESDASGYKQPAVKFFYFPISNMTYFKQRKNENDLQVFVSRKERLAGLVSFTPYGTLQLLNMYKFDSYPSSIKPGNFSSPNKTEVLVYGESFSGISLLEEKNLQLKEKKIIEQGIYSGLEVIDFDFDDFDDFAAVDELNNSLLFFYNDQYFQFTERRKIEFHENISLLSKVNFNNDEYYDLAVTAGKSVHILLGDSVYSFKNRFKINLDVDPDKILIKDFNKDKLPDLIFTGKSDKNLYIAAAKNEVEFYPSELLINNKNITDLKQINNITAAISSQGELILLDNINYEDSDFRFFVSNSADKIFLFNSKDKRFKDMLSVDSENSSVKVHFSEAKQFNSFKSLELSFPHKKMIANTTRDSVKTIYFFTPGRRLLEIMKIDQKNYNIFLEKRYTDNPILDLTHGIKEVDSTQTIFALVNKNGGLGVERFVYKDFRYIAADYDHLSDFFIDANITFDRKPFVFFSDTMGSVKRFHKKYLNIKYQFQTVPVKDTVIWTLPQTGVYQSIVKSSNTERIFFLSIKERSLNIMDANTPALKGITKALPYKFERIEELEISEIDKFRKLLLINDNFFLITESREIREFLPSYLIESENINGYFVTRLFGKNYFVYSTDKTGLINFSVIK